MHSDQGPYHQLVENLLSDRPHALNDDSLLDAWLAANPQEIRWLAELRRRPGTPIPEVSLEELWRLYALSRVFDTLLLRFQSGREPVDGWSGPDVTLEGVERFANGLGLELARPSHFCPFDHEIVHVDAVEGEDVLEIADTYWPRLMLGSLLIVRAGVRIRASADHVSKAVAERSTLYWTYRRRLRDVADLSHGWGHNSQWRTSFRRDYRLGREMWFNVDGDLDLNASTPPTGRENAEIIEEDGLTRTARIELLVNRCFVSVQHRQELWPFEDTARLHESVGRVGASWRLGDW